MQVMLVVLTFLWPRVVGEMPIRATLKRSDSHVDYVSVGASMFVLCLTKTLKQDVPRSMLAFIAFTLLCRSAQ